MVGVLPWRMVMASSSSPHSGDGDAGSGDDDAWVITACIFKGCAKCMTRGPTVLVEFMPSSHCLHCGLHLS